MVFNFNFQPSLSISVLEGSTFEAVLKALQKRTVFVNAQY